MAREVVTGYCWPQSVGAGEQVGLHLSSSGGRPVRVEVARVGARRTVVFRRRRGRGRRARDADGRDANGCGWPAALTLDVDPTWRSGYYEVVLEIDVDEQGATRPRVLRRAPGGRRAASCSRWHQHVARVQRLRRAQPLHRRHATSRCSGRWRPGYLLQAAGHGPPRHRDRRARSAERARTSATCSSTTCRVRRVGGLARLGAAVRRSGPSARATRSTYATNADLEDHPEVLDGAGAATCRSATTSTGRGACATPSRRSSRAAATSRSSRATRRSGRCASRTTPRRWSATRARFKDDPVLRHRPRARGHDVLVRHLVGRPENHMTGVSFARGGYHRIGRASTNGRGRLHGPPARPLAVRRHRPRLRRRARRRARPSSATSATAATSPTATGCRTRPARTARRRPSRSSAPRPPQHFTRKTAPRPPKPDEPSRARVHRVAPVRHA